MKNSKRFSLIMLLAPVLFIGCVSEKTTSLTPEITTKKTFATLESNMTIVRDDNQTAPEAYIQKEYEELASMALDDSLTLEEEIKPTPKLSFKYSWEDLTQGHRDSDLEDEDEDKKELTIPRLSFDDTIQAFNNKEAPKEDKIIETAKNFLGVKYVWAANGPSAFDCSGFTKYVFKQNGITLPRHSANQAHLGEKIEFSELQKGDLVFFDTEKKFKNRVNHVGIYIGDHKFIHASSANKKVVITSFDEKKFYKDKFLYAKRIINSNENVALNRLSY